MAAKSRFSSNSSNGHIQTIAVPSIGLSLQSTQSLREAKETAHPVPSPKQSDFDARVYIVLVSMSLTGWVFEFKYGRAWLG